MNGCYGDRLGSFFRWIVGNSGYLFLNLFIYFYALHFFLPTLSWCAVVERTMGSCAWSDKDGGERGVSGAWHTIEVSLPVRVNGAFISVFFFLSGLFCFPGIGRALLWWIELLSKTGPLKLWIFDHPSIPYLPSPVTFYSNGTSRSQNLHWNLSLPSSLLPMPHFPHLYPCPPTSLLLPPPTSERLRNVPPYACKWGCYKWWLGLMPMKGWCLAQSPAPPPPLPSLQISLGEPSSRWQPPTVRTQSFVACLWM